MAPLSAPRSIAWMAGVVLAWGMAGPAVAQSGTSTASDGRSGASPGRGYLGLNVGRSDYRVPCSPTALGCDRADRALHVYAGTDVNDYLGAQIGLLDMGRAERAGGRTRAQGLNLSLVGRAPVPAPFGVFGKVGATLGRTDTSAQAGSALPTGSEHGIGLSFGAGVSYDFTPRLSAVLEWDSHDFRFAGGGRDPVRATSLGLQYRY